MAEVIRLTQDAPPHEATHWTIRAMGKAVEAQYWPEWLQINNFAVDRKLTGEAVVADLG